MDAIYQINWNRWVQWNLPTFLRKVNMVRWLLVLIAPIVRLHLDFLVFRNKALYQVNHNSQICYLQAVLNDSFDNIQRRIVIRNAVIKEPIWFFEPEEDKPVLFYEEQDDKPVYFREEWELLGDGADFLVLIPLSLKPSNSIAEDALLIEIEAQLDYYKLFVKNYKIIWV